MAICMRSAMQQVLSCRIRRVGARGGSRCIPHYWRLLSAAALAAAPISFSPHGSDASAGLSPAPAAPPSVAAPLSPPPRSPWRRWRRLLAAFGSDIAGLLLACVLGVAAVSIGLMTPMVLADIWDALSSPDRARLLLPVLKLAAVVLSRFLLQISSDMLKVAAAEGVASRLREALYAALLHGDMARFDAAPSHDFVATLMDDVREIRDAVRMVVGDGIPALARAIGSAVALVLISPRMSAAIAAVFPAALYVGNSYAARLRALSRASADAQGRTTAAAGESLAMIRTVRAFAAEDVEVAKLKGLLQEQTEAHERVAREVSIFRGGMTLGLGLLGGGVLGYGGALVQRGDMTRAGVAAFAMETFTLEQSLTRLSALWGTSTRASGAADRVNDVLEAYHATQAAPAGAQWAGFKGDIVFDRVSFAYPTRRDVPALDGVSLHFKPGTVVALAGPSGSGKSTVCQLLLGFYHPCMPSNAGQDSTDAGMIRVDGRPLHEFVDMRWFRTHCGYVPQDPAMFRASVRDNITYGCTTATEEDVIAAARAANAWDFICALPDGLDTIVGERGAALSGGQRQRIALARALVRQPRILILDEYSSALDAESEALVQQALSRMQQDGSGRTVLIVAHRLSTIASADLIYVMERGRVVESGSHAELVQRGGKYATLVARQREVGSNDADFDAAAADEAEADTASGA